MVPETILVAVGSSGKRLLQSFFESNTHPHPPFAVLQVARIKTPSTVYPMGPVLEITGDTETGRRHLQSMLQGYKTVIILSGLGGRSGGTLTPLVIETAKQLGMLPKVCVTMPLQLEGARRNRAASQALEVIRQQAHDLEILSNQELIQVFRKPCTLHELYLAMSRQVGGQLSKWAVAT